MLVATEPHMIWQLRDMVTPVWLLWCVVLHVVARVSVHTFSTPALLL